MRIDRSLPRRPGVVALSLLLALISGALIPGLGPALRLEAQVTYGVNGTVTDPNGALIPAADVALTDMATGVVQHVLTGPRGTYVVIVSDPGTYSLTVSAKGFERSVRTNVTVEIGRFSSVPVVLVPGAASETVRVTAGEISLTTEDPGLGTTLEPELVETAPIEINGGPRSIDAFVLQSPGSGNPSSVNSEGGALNFNGGLTTLNNYYFNGVPVSDSNLSTYSEGGNFYPPYEMVSQYRVETSTFSAQYGLAQGIVTYKMASGTSRLHGDVFDISRNSFFDSDGFFPSNFNAAGDPVPPVNHQNDWGFTLGGPVILPRLYDGRSHTFFLVSLDWYAQNQGQTAFGTVPTPAEVQGDFSQYVDATGAMIPIYDPRTGQPFKGNVITPDRFSPISKSILSLIPAPNNTRCTDFCQQANELPLIRSVEQFHHMWGFTLDHNLTESHGLHLSVWDTSASSPGVGSNIVPSTSELQNGTSNTFTQTAYLLNYVGTLGPHLVVTAGLMKIDAAWHNFDALTGVSFPGIVGANTFPEITWAGPDQPSGWGQAQTDVSTRQVDVSAVNNWLWTPGRHTINLGGELRRSLQDSLNCANCGGHIQFSNLETSVPDPNDPNFSNYGSAFASFLLGSVDNVLREFTEETRLRDLAASPYYEDDYKVNNRLTVNAGLRWDMMVPLNAANDNLVFADLTAPNAAAGGLPGAATKYGYCTGCTNSHRADMHWGNVGPRVGFSYMLNQRTVLQGGLYRLFVTGGAYSFSASRVAQQYPVLLAGSFNASSTGTNVPGYGSWDARPIPDPAPTPFTPAIGNAQLIRQLDPRRSGITPYNQAWNIDIQRQLPWNMFLMAAYIGNRDIHLPSSLNQPNQLPIGDLAYGDLLNEMVDSPDAVAAGIRIPYPGFLNDFGSDATVEQALLPYPQFAGTDDHFDQAGSSFYNAAQLEIEKRYSNGLSFLSNLTLARNQANVDYGVTLQQNNPINTLNQRAEWSASQLNQRWAVKFVGTYALPIGRGQLLLNTPSRTLDSLLGGWKVSAVLDYYSGNPIGSAEDNVVLMATNANGDGVNRPNVVPGVARRTYSYSRTRQFFAGRSSVQPVQFTTGAFTPSPFYGLGDAARNYTSILSPPLEVEDLSAMKSFGVTERLRAILRVDYFNAFNRTQLFAPDNDISDTTFGMVTRPGSQISNRQGQANLRIEF